MIKAQSGKGGRPEPTSGKWKTEKENRTMNKITISKNLWMNTVAHKLNPGSAIDVVDYWYDRDGSVHIKYHRSFVQYSNVNFTAETVAIVLGYKSVKFNRDYSITATE
jgi:hypothetical protein